jgi:hypothetical protein
MKKHREGRNMKKQLYGMAAMALMVGLSSQNVDAAPTNPGFETGTRRVGR